VTGNTKASFEYQLLKAKLFFSSKEITVGVIPKKKYSDSLFHRLSTVIYRGPNDGTYRPSRSLRHKPFFSNEGRRNLRTPFLLQACSELVRTLGCRLQNTKYTNQHKSLRFSENFVRYQAKCDQKELPTYSPSHLTRWSTIWEPV